MTPITSSPASLTPASWMPKCPFALGVFSYGRLQHSEWEHSTQTMKPYTLTLPSQPPSGQHTSWLNVPSNEFHPIGLATKILQQSIITVNHTSSLTFVFLIVVRRSYQRFSYQENAEIELAII